MIPTFVYLSGFILLVSYTIDCRTLDKDEFSIRIRRQTRLENSGGSTRSTAGSSEHLNVTVDIQAHPQKDVLNTEDFVECIHEQYDDPREVEECRIEYDTLLGAGDVSDAIDGCGLNFGVQLGNVDYDCDCGFYLECKRKRGPRPRKEECTRLSSILHCLIFKDCTTSTSTSTGGIETTSPVTEKITSTTSGTRVDVSSSRSRLTAGTAPTASTFAPTLLSKREADVRLAGGVVGGVAGGVVITSIVVLVCCVCKGKIVTSYNVDKSSPSAQTKEDRKALCEEASSTSAYGPPSASHVYELPDVVGAIPTYTTPGELAASALEPSEVEYNHLGDHKALTVQNGSGPGHVYDKLDQAKVPSNVKVVNNEYSHVYDKAVVTQTEPAAEIPNGVSKAEDPPYTTIKDNVEDVSNHKYYEVEKPPQTPPYTTISETDGK